MRQGLEHRSHLLRRTWTRLGVRVAALGLGLGLAGCAHERPAIAPARAAAPHRAHVKAPAHIAATPVLRLRCYDVRDLVSAHDRTPADLIAWLEARTGEGRWGKRRFLAYDRGTLLVYQSDAVHAAIADELRTLREDARVAALFELAAAAR